MKLAEVAQLAGGVAAREGGRDPELIIDQVTGLLVEPGGLADAVRSVDRIDPWACRSHAETTFSLERMASRYAEIYLGARRPSRVST